MYIKTEVVSYKNKEKNRYGKFGERTRHRTVYHLKCNRCAELFTRHKGEMDEKRLCNDYRHYCESCFDYGYVAQQGRDKHIEALEKRIGKKWIDSCGYVNVYVGPKSSGKRLYKEDRDYCGSIREHTLVMEQHLGRPMNKGEAVHHIDGDKTNNKISNLQKMTVAEHNNCHAKNDALVMEMFRKGLVKYSRKEKRYYLK